MTGEQLLIKTIKQCNAFEARVIKLESDEYVNNLKADAIEAMLEKSKDGVSSYCRCSSLGDYDRYIESYIERLRK